jgi:hypothetical protein
VRYWYNDHKTKQRQEDEVSALTCIGRMVQHILPKGFHRIRYYGLHATPTVSLDVIPLVASSYGYYLGQIAPRAAQ